MSLSEVADLDSSHKPLYPIIRYGMHPIERSCRGRRCRHPDFYANEDCGSGSVRIIDVKAQEEIALRVTIHS